jgi:hypothetical protein
VRQFDEYLNADHRLAHHDANKKAPIVGASYYPE